MITERTLKKWRREALIQCKTREETKELYKGTAEGLAKGYVECQEKVLRMTQILLDQHLLRREVR